MLNEPENEKRYSPYIERIQEIGEIQQRMADLTPDAPESEIDEIFNSFPSDSFLSKTKFCNIFQACVSNLFFRSKRERITLLFLNKMKDHIRHFFKNDEVHLIRIADPHIFLDEWFLENGFISISTIVKEAEFDLKLSQYFLPEIIETNPSFFYEFLRIKYPNSFQSNLFTSIINKGSHSSFNDGINFSKEELDDIKKRRRNQIIANLNGKTDFESCNSYDPIPLRCCLMSDDIDRFQTILSNCNLSFNSICPYSVYDPILFPNNYIAEKGGRSLIEAAASFGSIQIFKFLLVNKAKFRKKEIFRRAIFGGSYDIFHMIENTLMMDIKVLHISKKQFLKMKKEKEMENAKRNEEQPSDGSQDKSENSEEYSNNETQENSEEQTNHENHENLAEQENNENQENLAEQANHENQENSEEQGNRENQSNSTEQTNHENQENSEEQANHENQENSAEQTNQENQENSAEQTNQENQENSEEQTNQENQENSAEQENRENQSNSTEQTNHENQENSAEQTNHESQNNSAEQTNHENQDGEDKNHEDLNPKPEENKNDAENLSDDSHEEDSDEELVSVLDETVEYNKSIKFMFQYGLKYAIKYGRDEIMEYLLDNYVDLFDLQITADSISERIVNFCMINFKETFFPLILAKPNDLDKYNNTYLISAAHFNYSDLVHLFLQIPGIDLNYVNARNGQSALSCAVEQNSLKAVKVILKSPLFKYSYEKTMDVTPFTNAASRGYIEEIMIFINFKKELEAKNKTKNKRKIKKIDQFVKLKAILDNIQYFINHDEDEDEDDIYYFHEEDYQSEEEEEEEAEESKNEETEENKNLSNFLTNKEIKIAFIKSLLFNQSEAMKIIVDNFPDVYYFDISSIQNILLAGRKCCWNSLKTVFDIIIEKKVFTDDIFEIYMYLFKQLSSNWTKDYAKEKFNQILADALEKHKKQKQT